MKAPVKPVFQRQDSVLTSLDDDAGFDDVDVSYDTSVEVVNLRNTALPTQTKRSADVLKCTSPATYQGGTHQGGSTAGDLFKP